MNWKNLKINLCPKCGSMLKSIGLLMPDYFCSASICKFTIHGALFDKIVSERYKPKMAYMPNDNFLLLNNLGRKKMSDDFSDSPFADRI